MNQKKKILFLTTSNLATNPRLVKEMDLAIQLGYRVTVISFSFENWSTKLNNQFKERFGSTIELKEIPAGRKPLFPWLLSTVFQEINKFFYLFTPNKLSVISFALMKRTWLLHKELQKKRDPVDFLVAHNPGSFYPAYAYSKKMKIPFGIDVEDYHPGETNHNRQSAMMRKMMQAVLPAAAYVTAASPLILEKVKEDCKEKLHCTEIILNYFKQSEFLPPVPSSATKLKLIWFSQNVSFNRGLEEILPIIDELHENIELHIIGNLYADFEEKHIVGKKGIIVQKPMLQKELHKFLSTVDVGLAIEPGKDLNNKYALTNKILAYFQAGLYLLASDTIAQKQFIEQYPKHGTINSLKDKNLKGAFQILIENKNIIRQKAISRFETASAFNCENELQRLVPVWNSVAKSTL